MMKKTLFFGPLVLTSLLVVSCTSQKFDAPMKLGGEWISAETLNLGHDTYQMYCMQCHGVEGDGMGPAAQGSMPLPRNLQLGVYKFGSVTTGELPTDEDLKYTIRFGLRGTPMLPWDISDKRLNAVVQYIKTFSPRWLEEEAGEPQRLTPDPFGPQRASEAIALGKKVYHGFAQCFACHPTYVGLDEISKYSEEMTGNPVSSIRENPHLGTLLDSEHEVKIMPPDFTKNFIKTSGEIATTYKMLGTGIGGTAMPAWKDMLSPTGDVEESERNLWALAYYVNYLHSLKYDIEERKKFMDALNKVRPMAAR